MNGFKVVSNMLLESEGEYPELDKQVASWWRSTIANFKDSCRSLFNHKELPKETQMISNIVSGVKIIVRGIADSGRRSFIMPGILPNDMDNWITNYEEWRHKHLAGLFDSDYDSIPPLCYMAMNSIKNLKNMSNYKLIPDKNGKKKIVFPKSDLEINIFITHGFLTSASPEARMGIYLHELGHWIDAAAKIPKQMLLDPDREKIYYAFYQMGQRVNARYQEYAADDFAKQMGYGEELAKGLDQIADVRKNVHWMARFDDWFIKQIVHADNEFEEKGKKYDTGEYPSFERRKEWLRKKEEK